jgi:hypothetical protein
VLTLRARPERRAEIVAPFERLEILRQASAVPGLLDAELHAYELVHSTSHPAAP